MVELDYSEVASAAVDKWCQIILALLGHHRTLGRAVPEGMHNSITRFMHMRNRYNSPKITSTILRTNKVAPLQGHYQILEVVQVSSWKAWACNCQKDNLHQGRLERWAVMEGKWCNNHNQFSETNKSSNRCPSSKSGVRMGGLPTSKLGAQSTILPRKWWCSRIAQLRLALDPSLTCKYYRAKNSLKQQSNR